MTAMCCSDDPLPWYSLPDGIDKTMQMMADSQKDLSDYVLSGQAAVHDSVNQYQSRLLELAKLRSQQHQTNCAR
jgi:hypothetical protein